MRSVWLVLASGVVATASAAVLVEPWVGGNSIKVSEERALTPSTASDTSPPARLRLPTPPRLQAHAQPLLEPLPASACTQPHSGAADQALQAKIADLRQQLFRMQDELRAAQWRIGELVADRCDERFEVELDEWLDGPLGWLHHGDEPLRERLRDTLSDLAWHPAMGASEEGGCPMTVERLRARVSDGDVVQLSELLAGWQRERERLPTLEFQHNCGNAPGGPTAIVHFAAHDAILEPDHPLVRTIAAEKQRVDRDWRSRINGMFGLALYELD